LTVKKTKREGGDTRNGNPETLRIQSLRKRQKMRGGGKPEEEKGKDKLEGEQKRGGGWVKKLISRRTNTKS